MRAAVAVLLLAACAPKVLTLPTPDFGPAAAVAGPTVSFARPIDARLASERRDGGYYQANSFPTLTYGEASIRPGTIELLDRVARAALPAAGIPVVPREDADLRVRMFVL